MAKEMWANNAQSVITGALTTGSTSVTVTTGHGAKFPAPTGGDFFWATLDDGVNIEIVAVSAKATDTFTVTRAQQGTGPFAFAIGTKFEIRATAATFERLRAPQESLVVAGGYSGAITYITAATYTVTDADSVIFVDTTSNAITLNLFTTTGRNGRALTIVRVSAGANLVTIDPAGSETVIGQTTYLLKSIWESVTLVSSGSAWLPVASHFYESFQITRVLSNQTTTGTTATDVTSMSFSINTSETWIVTYNLKVSCGTGGVRFAINAPTGATLVMQVQGGATATVTAFTSSQVTALNTLTTEGYAVSATRQVQIVATIVNSTTAGTVALRFASLTSGQTSTIFANSTMNAQRLGA